jgi:hypothetical protein
LSQAPQFLGSLVTSRQPPAQATKPASHVKPQALPAQRALAWAGAGQAVVQLPQCAASLSSRTHVPLQVDCPAGQVETHSPFEHASPSLHARSQEPQCATLLRMSTQAPPHLANPTLHENAHAPAWHSALPCAGTSHSLLHAPH